MNNYIINFILGTVLVTGLLIWVWLPNSNAKEEVSATAQQYLMNLSMTQQDAYVLIEECRKTERPNKCVMFWGAIRAQEWGYWTKHPFWMLSQPSWYKWEVKVKNTAEYSELRVWSFTRYWHKTNDPNKYITHHKNCTSGCEHWVPNVTRFIAWYDSGVIPNEWALPVWSPPNTNLRQKAKDQEQRTQELFEKYVESKQKTYDLRKQCVAEWITCK